ncbi:Arm DNA-binding domain-containing protein [Thiocapsa sp.]|uniref:Arm DNA-binding domain-containing protein n=1 Tax=Thiocapsa sp. TaxID=2024551 RepID=UPI0035939EDC
MGSVRVRPQSGTLYFDFRYRGTRCREQTLLKDTAANRRKMAQVLEKIEAEITLGTFNYRGYFPNSPTADRFDAMARGAVPTDAVPDFETFSEDWFDECRVGWKTSYAENVSITLKAHLVPHFGKLGVNRVSKADILKFRASLAKVTSRSKKPLSSDRINHIMTPLRMILREAADRFHFTDPWQGIKPLKVPRTEVDPFTLEELERFLAAVRPDYRDYYVTRFFTGLRTAEIDGLKWRYVDLERRVILVSDTWVNGREETPKTPGSVRHVELSGPVVAALKRQQKLTGKGDYVFCNREGKPLDRRNVMRRIWFPTLDLLGLRRRRPYQTRHTAATLWLACGESPEWIARQMGHANTQMLFRVYSRYVPNLTRQDGSAMERLLAARGLGDELTPQHGQDEEETS